MTKQEILEYIQKTPENINPAILFQMLDQLVEDSKDAVNDGLDE